MSAVENKIRAELDHAYSKHGRDPWSRHEFYGVLKEEVDELWDAIKRDEPTENVIKEALQIACVCVRYIETDDRYRGPHLPLDARLAALEASACASPPPEPKCPHCGEASCYHCWECGNTVENHKPGCRSDSSPPPDVPSAEHLAEKLYYIYASGIWGTAAAASIAARDAQWRGQAAAQHEKYVRSFKGLKDRAERAEARVRELEAELQRHGIRYNENQAAIRAKTGGG